jgi:hypothetical protein
MNQREPVRITRSDLARLADLLDAQISEDIRLTCGWQTPEEFLAAYLKREPQFRYLIHPEGE